MASEIIHEPHTSNLIKYPTWKIIKRTVQEETKKILPIDEPKKIEDKKEKNLNAIKTNIWEKIFRDIESFISKDSTPNWSLSGMSNLNLAGMSNYKFSANLDYGFAVKPTSLKEYIKSSNIKSKDIIDELIKNTNYLSIMYINILHDEIHDYRYQVVLEENMTDNQKDEYNSIEKDLKLLVDKLSDKVVQSLT